MAVDYARYSEIVKEKRAEFVALFRDPVRGAHIFSLLHEARGYVMASASDWAPDMQPDDVQIEDMVRRLEEVVGEAYPQKEEPDALLVEGRTHYRISRVTTGEFDLSVRVILLDGDLEDIDEVYETDNEADARAFIREREGVLRVVECTRCHEQQHLAPCMVCHNPVMVGANIEP